jgi:methionyl-tRNA formyltransferase
MPKIVFFGSSEYSVFVLQQLITYNLQLIVITPPDKPVGRHLRLTPNPVKLLALKNNLQVFENISELTTYNLQPNSIGLVAAYGRIIPQLVLDIFNTHIYNIHPSLLPKYRGSSPLQQQILDGVVQTGVTIIQLDAQMDHGPIVAQKTHTISDSDTPLILGKRLFELGIEMFIKKLTTNNLKPIAVQDDSRATYTHKLTRQDGFIEYSVLKNYLELRSLNLEFERKFRAFSPWPGIWSINPEGKRVILKSLQPVQILVP